MKKAGHRGGTRAKARPKAKRAARAGNTRKSAAKKVVLLSGGNPQIAKGEGDAPVQAYIGAMPDWKRAVGRRLDALIVRSVPSVRKAVKWNSPFYGIETQGWFLSFHVLLRRVSATASTRSEQAQNRALPRHPRGRRARRGATHELGEAGRGNTGLARTLS